MMVMMAKPFVWLSIETIALFSTINLAVAGCNSAVTPISPKQRLTIDRQRLYAHVEFLSSIEGFRQYTNTIGLERSVTYIQDLFSQTGGEVNLQDFQVDGRIYQNVICSLGPRKGARVIIGAHYDVCGPQPGADDNASAVASLLEIGRLLAKQGGALNYRLDLVAYCLEEPPFFDTVHMGSYVHAKSLHDAQIKVKEMISLEMVGYFTNQKNSQAFPLGIMKWFYPSTGDFIGVVTNLAGWWAARRCQKDMRAAADIEVCLLGAPAFTPGVKLSDHSSYWKFGYPALMITDTAFYRNPNYHQPSDTIDTLDFDKMAEVIKGVCHHILQLQNH